MDIHGAYYLEARSVMKFDIFFIPLLLIWSHLHDLDERDCTYMYII